MNPVAKFAPKFNKAVVHRDRTKPTRKEKHQLSIEDYLEELYWENIEEDEDAENRD